MKRSGFKRRTHVDAAPSQAISRTRLAVEKVCATCSKRFEILPCRLVRGGGKYCSRKCASVGRRSKLSLTCKACGSPFQMNPSQLKHYKGAGQYCSKKCHGKAVIESTAKKPITDRYGRTSRHADKLWQQAVREKDNYTCQRCGKYDLHISTHHVAPRGRRPDLRHVVENGKCLDHACHMWVHHHPIEATALGLLSDATYEFREKKDPVLCKVCGSDKRHAGHGYCIKHYKRFWKYGDPLLTKKHGGGANELMKVAPDASMR
jgi:hypothetical protein